MKDPPNTLPFFSNFDATKNVINHITHIFKEAHLSPVRKFYHYLQCYHRVRMKILTIISTLAQSPRVKPVLQPPKVKTKDSAPTPPPIDHPSSYPILDPYSNPWSKKISKYKKTPHILKSIKTQAAPRQVQHRLRRSPRNIGTNFPNPAAQNLVANHLFKLPHVYHIYKKQDKKETIYTLLLGGDSKTW